MIFCYYWVNARYMMAKINSDKHGLYFTYNGTVWRPIIPVKEQSIAAARKMLPDPSGSLVGSTAKPKGIEDFFVRVTINDVDYLWYNHGRKPAGVKSESVYRNFDAEDAQIKSLIASGMTVREAYAHFWASLN